MAYPVAVILYYITDRAQFPGTEAERRRALLERIAEAAKADVDLIQLREKDLSSGSLEKLAIAALKIVRGENSRTRLLINSRIDVALAVGADGVHLTSADTVASEARGIVARAHTNAGREILITVACRSALEVRLAEAHGADFAVLAPILGKQITYSATLPGIGLGALRAATQIDQPRDLRVEAGDRRTSLPVLALGGITLENASQCLASGAAGIAGIRLFQEGDVAQSVAELRRL
jgi:thiamine-phosphate pyrophosphorylase